jgi:surfactin synthase thioesterase subunit
LTSGNSSPPDWVRRRLAAGDHAPTVYSVPPLGAGAGRHTDLADALADEIELAALRLPGRESRVTEEPFDSVDAVVAELAPLVIDDVRARALPFALLGDCSGSLAAYELARQCEAVGAPAQVLVVVDHPMPSSLPDQVSSVLSDAALRAKLAARGLAPAEVLDDDELFEFFLPNLRADLNALESYQPAGRLRETPVEFIAVTVAASAAASWRPWAEQVRSHQLPQPSAQEWAAGVALIVRRLLLRPA